MAILPPTISFPFAMPNVGLFTADEPVSPDTPISIRYSVEVGGLPVYTELYDVRRLRRELDEDRNKALAAWECRLVVPVEGQDKPRFSCVLTNGLHPEDPFPASPKRSSKRQSRSRA